MRERERKRERERERFFSSNIISFLRKIEINISDDKVNALG